MGSNSPQSVQMNVRNSGINADFGVIHSNVIGSPQYSQEGTQIFPFNFKLMAAPCLANTSNISIGSRLVVGFDLSQPC